jgi:hypothetical protein
VTDRLQDHNQLTRTINQRHLSRAIKQPMPHRFTIRDLLWLPLCKADRV